MRGVSKATIYRRFESKLDLVTAAMYQVAEERKPTPDTGSLLGDIHALLDQLTELTQDETLGCNVRMMVADGLRNPELAAVHEEFVQYRRTGTKVAFERGSHAANSAPTLISRSRPTSSPARCSTGTSSATCRSTAVYTEQVVVAFIRLYGV